MAKILAVTACPTGIAHTYMAAEKLTEKAKEMGISLKVETNGSSGVKNRLTDADIAEADAIIVAADTKVEMARFNGKPVIQTKVGKAIYETEELLNRAIIKMHQFTSMKNRKMTLTAPKPKVDFINI